MRESQWKELTTGHLLKSGCMKNEISTRNGATAGLKTSYISDVEFNLMGNIRVLCLILVSHIILLLLIA